MQEVCIVIPCFNEEKRLKRREILDFLHTHQSAAVCFVDDGSSDGTAATLGDIRRSAPQSVLVLELPVNGGKAEAVRRGMLHAACSRRFSLIGYWDADMSTPLRELATMLDVFAHDPGCKVVMGSRVRRLGSTIQRSAARHYLGRVFSTLASLLLKLPVYDSQCGAKLVRAELVDVLFSERFLTKWIFDVEILARLRNHLGPDRALDAVCEVPLREWLEVGGSKLRPKHVAKVPIELLRIAMHYNRTAVHAAAAEQISPSQHRP